VQQPTHGGGNRGRVKDTVIGWTVKHADGLGNDDNIFSQGFGLTTGGFQPNTGSPIGIGPTSFLLTN